MCRTYPWPRTQVMMGMFYAHRRRTQRARHSRGKAVAYIRWVRTRCPILMRNPEAGTCLWRDFDCSSTMGRDYYADEPGGREHGRRWKHQSDFVSDGANHARRPSTISPREAMQWCALQGSPDCISNGAGGYVMSCCSAGTGYDMATGLGSVDAAALGAVWPKMTAVNGAIQPGAEAERGDGSPGRFGNDLGRIEPEAARGREVLDLRAR